jgi:hypothetical protein
MHHILNKKTDDAIILNMPFRVLHKTHYRFSVCILGVDLQLIIIYNSKAKKRRISFTCPVKGDIYYRPRSILMLRSLRFSSASARASQRTLFQLYRPNIAKFDHKCTLVFIQGPCYFSTILTKTGICQQISVKISPPQIPNTKFHKNQFRGIRALPCENADGQT